MLTRLFSIRNWLFGTRSIAVGHCHTHKGSCVLLLMGRKRAGLTPEGARKIADQLRIWADHAESHGSAIKMMQWIVHVTMEDDPVKKAASEWTVTNLAKTAEEVHTAP